MTVTHKADEDPWNEGIYEPLCNQKGSLTMSIDDSRVNCQKCLSIISKIADLNVNRVELIDKNGRQYVRWKKKNFRVECHLQNNGRTLKIFVRSD
jgi:hypothetical protein